MNSQVIQTPIKFSIKTNNLDNIHKKVDKPLLKTSLTKSSSKLLHSNDIFTNINFQDELEINKSKSDKPLVNGVPLIKKHLVSDSAKKDVTLKRSFDTNLSDEMASKIRKCDNQEDMIIIESESSSKLVIHPLKTVKNIEPISISKEVETVSAIFKALEEKISNIDKICKTNQQNPSKNENEESKDAINRNQEKSNKIIMKVNSNKCIIENKKLFSDDDYKEDKRHESKKINSKSENSKSNLKSLKESLIKERKRSNELNQKKTKSSHRDSKENDRKSRENKNDYHGTHRESYKSQNKKDNYKEKRRNYDDHHNRKSVEKSSKSNLESKKTYTTLGEEIKSQSIRDTSKDIGKLHLIVKDEYHSQTIVQSTIDLSEQVLEDSFKLSNKKQCSVKDKLKITENIKKLLDRKNNIKSNASSINAEDRNEINKSDPLVLPTSSKNEQNLIAPNSFEPANNLFSTFKAESLDNNNKTLTDTLNNLAQSDVSKSSKPVLRASYQQDIATKPSTVTPCVIASPSFFVKTANISFKISPKKMQIGNIFSQVTEPVLTSPTKTIQAIDQPSNIVAVDPVITTTDEIETNPSQSNSSTFKVPFNVEKKLKKINLERNLITEESLNIEQNPIKNCDLDIKSVDYEVSEEKQIDSLHKQEVNEVEVSAVEINVLPPPAECQNDKQIPECVHSDNSNIEYPKERAFETIPKDPQKISKLESNSSDSLVNIPQIEDRNIKSENSTKPVTVESNSLQKIDKKHESKSREHLNEKSIEVSKQEKKSHSKSERSKDYHSRDHYTENKNLKDNSKSKRLSRSHSPSNHHSHSKNQNFLREKRSKSRSDSRHRFKAHKKSRFDSRDNSKSRKRSTDKLKSRKRSKHRSNSRKSIINHSRSRKYSNDHQESRKHSTDHSKLKRIVRNHSKSKERSKDIKSRKQSRNHLRSERLSKDRFASKRRSKEKSKSRKKSKDHSRSRKRSAHKSKRRDNSSRSSSKQKPKNRKYNSKNKVSTESVKDIKKIKPEFKENKSPTAETRKDLENISQSDNNLTDLMNKIENKDKEIKNDVNSTPDKPQIDNNDCVTQGLSNNEQTEVNKDLLINRELSKLNEISCKEEPNKDLPITNPSQELLQHSKPSINSETPIINEELSNICRIPVEIASKQSDDSGISANTIPTRITNSARDPRFNKDEKSVGNYRNDFLNPPQYNSNFKSDERNTNNIIQPPPPPPSIPHFQVSIPYNIQFDQNAYLNSLNNFNFDLTNYFRDTAQCNSLNSTVPQNTYNATNTYSMSNLFQRNSYDQSSYGQWFFPNEYRVDTCNQYPINESFFNNAVPFPVQPQPRISATGFADNLLPDYNDRNYRGYDESDQNVSYNSTFSNVNEDRYHQTMCYNSKNKKSSTSSLMNEVMDMDLASESCKSIDSHKVIDANDQMSDKDDLSSCGDFEYEAASPLDPFEKFPLAPKPNYEHIIETEVHPSANGKRFEYAYLKSTVCNCVPPNPDEIKHGKTACGENCFNRSIKVECNRKCPVYELCTNRRFQERIYAPFEPFYCTNGKGWGIRSTNRIYPGTFIIEYVGELIDFQEFLKRVHQKSNYNHHFIMSIQKNMFIDAGSKGNWSRFVNHSCDPNTIIERWVVNGKTRIGFFSKKMIEEDEEITIDYQFQQYGMIEQKCFCNSANCTGVMGKLNEKLQDQIKTSHIKTRKELIQKIINRSCLKVINHVSDLITVIKEEFPDRDTFYGFLEILLRTDSEDCIRAFIECGGLKIITNFLDIISWNDFPLKLLYLKCLDHFKLTKRILLNSGQTAIQVVEYWSENPRYSLKHCQEEISPDKDLSDIENGQEFTEETLEIDRNTTIEFTLNDSSDQLATIETEIKDLAINIKQYIATEKQKFYIPKLKIVHSDSVTDLNDSESKSKDSASRASSIQGDYVKSRKRRIRRRCTDVIRKLSKDEFRRLFSERHEKLLLEKTQASTVDTISTLSNIDTNSSEFFEVVKKLLSNVIIDEINRLKHSEKFATMPIEFQNLDLDKILSDLNIVGHEDIMSLINHNFDENKTSSASTYSNSSSRSLDDNSKSDLNGLVKNPTNILPPNWNSRKADNGEFYYYNIITKITQWEIPVYPWDAGEEDPAAYNFGNASDYQISREDVHIMYEEYKKQYKLQKLEERRRTRLERSIQRKLNLTAGERNKIEFSKQVFRVVKTIVKPYNTSACKIGRIQHKQDLKFLCEKFADTIIGKEVKLVANLEDLEMNANVQSKIKTYIEKYMANQGRIYKRSSKIKPKSSKKFTLTGNSVNDSIANTSQTAESTNQLHYDFNNSPDFSP